MKLTLGFSPCPNDTFIFDALVNKKIDTEGLEFEIFFDDVETLNQKAFKGELDITKLSYHAFAYAADQYALLDAGSALGFGVGPLLISKTDISEETMTDKDRIAACSGREPVTKLALRVAQKVNELKIGIPGKYTTANFLLSLAFPMALQKQELVFSEIEPKLLNDEIDLGLIIHENRFTYQQKGLKKVIDLGEYWEQLTGAPIPLGGICVKRELPVEIQQKVNRIIRKSVEFACKNPKEPLAFVKAHAQEMDEEVMYKHITTYVNKFSIDLGHDGKKAVQTMFNIAAEKGIIQSSTQNLFVS
ncbi:menaquinone biosynthesis family protein [Solitalea lacus]|uniref:menaquinone biosynthesis family protein n=1 Tax=Solitalea lacus TaxID=2911172 RepID=UPI001EDBB677|nr:1,4-dihydroxy-6-naphthoate synthase [Solitalea lacus]UKJ08196.1 1,4-dihydroxy-6-naphthoate synthase [Solitalea lacus]